MLQPRTPGAGFLTLNIMMQASGGHMQFYCMRVMMAIAGGWLVSLLGRVGMHLRLRMRNPRKCMLRMNQVQWTCRVPGFAV